VWDSCLCYYAYRKLIALKNDISEIFGGITNWGQLTTGFPWLCACFVHCYSYVLAFYLLRLEQAVTKCIYKHYSKAVLRLWLPFEKTNIPSGMAKQGAYAPPVRKVCIFFLRGCSIIFNNFPSASRVLRACNT